VIAAALLTALSVTWLTAPANADGQPTRWLWYATTSGWHHANVVRLAAGPHVTVYAERGTVTRHDARVIADAVSWRIYPTDTATFGMPHGLHSVSIALLPLGGITLGYFNEDDIAPNRPGADARHSNRGNFLYIRTPDTMPDTTRLADVGEVAAHELQHLIDFRIRVVGHGWAPEDDWLNEGLSVYAQFANHYFTERDALKIKAAAATPGWQLTDLNSSNASVVANARAAYGHAGLFVSYLAARFGPSITREIIGTRNTGMAAVAQALSRRHASLTRVFADWGVASLLNQPGRYGYGSLRSLMSATPRYFAPAVTGSQLQFGYGRRVVMSPWSHEYLALGSGTPGTLEVHLHGAVDHIRAAVVLERPGITSATTVHWLRPDFNGALAVRLRDFGEFYTKGVVVLADSSSGAQQRAVRLEMHLVGTSGTDGASGLAPTRRRSGGRATHVSHTK
jgi:hypothetical protein